MIYVIFSGGKYIWDTLMFSDIFVCSGNIAGGLKNLLLHTFVLIISGLMVKNCVFLRVFA